MKKLMIAAAIVCAAAVSQAATTAWGFTSGLDEGYNGAQYADGYTAMLFTGKVSESKNADGTWALNFLAADFVDSSPMNDDYTFGPNIYKYGESPNYENTTLTPTDFTLIMFADTDVVDYEKYEGGYALYYFDENAILQDEEHEGEFYAKFVKPSAVSSGDYHTASSAIPEPTSGLLLLLGVAGLALRRRRA